VCTVFYAFLPCRETLPVSRCFTSFSLFWGGEVLQPSTAPLEALRSYQTIACRIGLTVLPNVFCSGLSLDAVDRSSLLFSRPLWLCWPAAFNFQGVSPFLFHRLYTCAPHFFVCTQAFLLSSILPFRRRPLTVFPAFTSVKCRS